jgi:hypothetical protein
MLDTVTGRNNPMSKVMAARVIQRYFRARLANRIKDGVGTFPQKKVSIHTPS